MICQKFVVSTGLKRWKEETNKNDSKILFKNPLQYGLLYRRVVWKHILNVYPEGMSGKERMEYTRRKSEEYYKLRDIWKDLLKRGQVSFVLQGIASLQLPFNY